MQKREQKDKRYAGNRWGVENPYTGHRIWFFMKTDSEKESLRSKTSQGWLEQRFFE
jgi:hypothetical protein